MTPQTLALSLVSHTNVGKTTLARTLLREDIGEVRDQAHVTLDVADHVLIHTPQGDRLVLWDTPGFGDSHRLARRLAQSGNPIGWFLSEVWDRFRDRAFWSSQRAVRHLVGDADVVLYLVNAAEAPEDAGYLDPELQVLSLIGKPVLVLLNQLGPPRPSAEEAAEVERWRQRLGDSPVVRQVLALDAFARCWVQERVLLQAVAQVVAPEKQAAMGRLQAAWAARNRATWQASMAELAARLVRATLAFEAVPNSGWAGRLKELGAQVGLRRDAGGGPREQAMKQLARRLADDVSASTDRLIALHGLSGQAAREVMERVASHYAVQQPLNEGKAALWGGAVTGALAGLKADVLSGGLTLGGGMLAGGLLGALSAAGLAKGYNIVRGVEAPMVTWSEAALMEMAGHALLGYLAVAHHGRGRGDWVASEAPAFWRQHVDAVLAAHGPALRELIEQAQDAFAEVSGPGDLDEHHAQGLVPPLEHWFAGASAELLTRLYAVPAALFEAGSPSAGAGPAPGVPPVSPDPP